MTVSDKNTFRNLLKEDLNLLRNRRGCFPLSRISEARNLTSFLKYKGESDEYKKLCLIAVVRNCFEDEVHKGGRLLASLNLLDGYESIKSHDDRLEQYQKDHLPVDVHVGKSMLCKLNLAAINEFTKWLVERKALGELDDILRDIDNKSAEKQKSEREYKHNLPNRNADYIDRKGRSSLLDDIWGFFSANEKLPKEQVVYGMGGVGKTQIASAYAHRFRDKYPVICWIGTELIFENAVEFVKYMEPEEYERLQNVRNNDQALTTVFRRWFENNTGWLLVFDDVDNKKQIEPYMPQESGGHILITSRTALQGISKAIHIEVFDSETAVDFLMNRTKRTNKEEAETLAVKLGYLPLALEQSAAFISANSNVDFAKYLSLLKRHGIDIFDEEYNNELPYYKHTVKTTWKISMDRISAAAKQLLFMYSNIALVEMPIFIRSAVTFSRASHSAEEITVENVPVQLFSDLCHELKWKKPIQELVEYSLAGYNSDAGILLIHPLLRGVIQDEIKDDAIYAKYCLHLLDALVNSGPNNQHHDLLSLFHIMKRAERILATDPAYCDYIWFRRRIKNGIELVGLNLPIYLHGKFQYREGMPEVLFANAGAVWFMVEEVEESKESDFSQK